MDSHNHSNITYGNTYTPATSNIVQNKKIQNYVLNMN
jgi:hypothetical protein